MAERRKPDLRILAPVLVVHLIIATLTWRDIKRRPAAQIRGPKPVWRLASAANTLGSLAYWLVGRRPAAEPPLEG
jgi:hypothetical protein